MNKCRSFCNIYLSLKKILFAYMEKTVIGDKELKMCITLLIMIQIVKNFRFFLSVLDGLD